MSLIEALSLELLSASDRLERVARRVLDERLLAGEADALAEFRDRRGNRLPVDAPLLAHAVSRTWRAEADARSPDLRMWAAAHDEHVPIDVELDVRSRGELVRRPDDLAIEVWTELELCTLHAAWHAGFRRTSPAVLGRCIRAAVWHIEHIQPDNATNHPWATHVFLIAGQLLGGDSRAWELSNHAHMMIHTCQVQDGQPDKRSAVILLDSALAIRRFVEALRGQRLGIDSIIQEADLG